MWFCCECSRASTVRARLAQGENWPLVIQGLNLPFLIHIQHHRVLERIQIEHNAHPQRQSPRRLRVAGPLLKFLAFFIGQHDRLCWSAGSRPLQTASRCLCEHLTQNTSRLPPAKMVKTGITLNADSTTHRTVWGAAALSAVRWRRPLFGTPADDCTALCSSVKIEMNSSACRLPSKAVKNSSRS